MINLYANQSIQYRKCIGQKDNGDITYADVETIKGRFVYNRKKIINKDGAEIISESSVLTSHPIKEDDIIVWDEREWIVKAVTDATGLNGSILHHEAWL